MERRPKIEGQHSYLVEHYRPGLSVEELRRSVSRVRDTVVELEREGRPVHYVRSTIVPADESFLCVFEAASEDVIREAYACAGLSFERISTAISEED